MALPTIGRIVIYRHPLPKGSYDVPAVVSATSETLRQARDAGLDTRHVRELTGEDHLHLTVFSPLVTCPDGVEHARDVPPAVEDEPVAPGTWRWPRPAPMTFEYTGNPELLVDEVMRRIAQRASRG